jgi:hypothetical protein
LANLRRKIDPLLIGTNIARPFSFLQNGNATSAKTNVSTTEWRSDVALVSRLVRCKVWNMTLYVKHR